MDLRAPSGTVRVKRLLEHDGRAYDYQGHVSDMDFLIFIDSLPQPHGQRLHDYLSADGTNGVQTLKFVSNPAKLRSEG